MRVLLAILLMLVVQAHADEQSPDCNGALADPPMETGGWATFRRAKVRWREIETCADRFEKDEKPNFDLIIQAINAALTKHQNLFEKSRDPRRLDVAQHLAILRAIEAFDPLRPKFSLYKIKRAIEERHSLKEYVGCT